MNTPNLDELCSLSATFTRAYSPAPMCIPARACLATGQAPYTNGRIGYVDGIPWDFPNTLMSVLRDSGYQTINVGKTHFFPDRAHLGFEVNRVYANEPHARQFDPSFVSDYHEWLRGETSGTVRDSTEHLSSISWQVRPWKEAEYLHPNSWTTRTAIDELSRRDPTRPFFLQIGYHRPHPPLDPPERFYSMYRDRSLTDVPVGDWAGAYDVPVSGPDYDQGRLAAHLLDMTRRGYLAQIAALDFEVGQLFLWLRQRRMFDSTVIVFASDHGEMLGDHHHFGKMVPFEGSARIPLIVKASGGSTPVVNGSPVTLADIMPTLLDLAGVTIPPSVEGKSFLPVISGSAERAHEWIHGEHSPFWQFIVDDHYKFAWRSDTGEEWLFDLQNDPKEMTNLAGETSHAEKLSRLRARLVSVLETRPENQLVVNGVLSPGVLLPPVRGLPVRKTGAKPGQGPGPRRPWDLYGPIDR